jgi:signal-transduction protein with cAMP-binding, CBS, and nucleotidyltransferase domain
LGHFEFHYGSQRNLYQIIKFYIDLFFDQLTKLILNLKMEEIYKPIEELIFCRDDTHVKAIAALFLTHKISCVVVKKSNQPVGIVTKTDLLVSLIKPNFSTAKQIMNSNLMYVELSDSIPEVSALMNDRKIHHALVRSNGKFVGLVTSTDIVSLLLRKIKKKIKVI